MQISKHLFAIAFSVLGAIVAPTATAEAQGYVVIVNAADANSSLAKAEVSNIFLKKSTKLTPVDLAKSSATREAFSKAVHGRAASAIQSYWQQQIFSGKEVPPAEKSSDAEIIAFVKSTPGSIGYVSERAELGDGVKAVTVK